MNTIQSQFTKKTTRVSHFFSLTILLSGLNIIYISKLSQGIATFYETRMFMCLSLNFVSFLLLTISCKFAQKQYFSLSQDKQTMLFTFFTLVTNFQLFWEPMLSHFPSSSLAGSALLYLHGLIPMFSYNSFDFRTAHWGLATSYSIYIHYSTQSIESELALCYGLSAIFFFYGIQSDNTAQKESPQPVAKDTPSPTTNFFSKFIENAEEHYFVVNKDLELVSANKAFSEEFNLNTDQKASSVLEQFTQPGCTRKIFEILDRNLSFSTAAAGYCSPLHPRSPTTPRAKNSPMSRFSSERQGFTLKKVSELLFQHTQLFKDSCLGWNATTQKSKAYETPVFYKGKPAQIRFSYMEEAGEDFVLFKIDSKVKKSAQNNSGLSMTEIASIIHELRTPLNGVIFLLQQAMEQITIPREVRMEMLEPSFESAKRLNFLINDMLDFASILEGKFRVVMEPFYLENALIHPIKIIRALAQSKGVNVDLFIDPSVPKKIATDQNRLIQIIYNLLGNAVKFTREGNILLSVTMSKTRRRSIEFSVRDTGYGIKSQDLGKLFQAFEKLDNWHDNKVGTGLGLCISNAIAKSLGGSGLSVKSEPEKGSTFSFVIENGLLEEEMTPKSPSSSPKYSTFAPAHLTGKVLPTCSSTSELSRAQRIPSTTAEVPLREKVLKEQIKKGASRTKFFLAHMDSSEVLPDLYDSDIRTVHYDFNNPSVHSSPESKVNKDPVSPVSGKYNLDELESNGRSYYDEMTFAMASNRTLNITTPPNNTPLIFPSNCDCPQVIAVDDEPLNLTMLKIICNSLSIGVKCFNGGQEVVEHFKKNGDSFKCNKCFGTPVILMDCNMPIIDGFDTSRELKILMKNRMVPHMPIFACTADESLCTKNKILKCGMDGVVSKPVRREELQTILKEFTGRPY